jgi:hypothetical protein
MLKDSKKKYKKVMFSNKGERKKLDWEAVESAKRIMFVSSRHPLSSPSLEQ